MRDKHNDSCTGSDYYFEKALQYPEFSSTSSSFKFHNTGRFVLLPSSLKSGAENGHGHDHGHNQRYSYPSRTTYHARPTLPFTTKHLRYSPTDSPGSDGTGHTSQCTETDVDEDLESHCGSLCYSVESWTLEHNFPTDDEIDDGYNAEDEHTTAGDHPHRHHSSFYSLDHSDDDCYEPDNCFLPLSWVQDWFHESFRKLESLAQDIQRNLDGTESRRRLGHQASRV